MLGYIARLACTSLWRNRWISSVAIVTTAVLLLIVSGFFVLMAGLNVSVQALQAKVNVVVYLKDTITDAQRQDLEAQLRSRPGVVSVAYSSKSDALGQLRAQFADRPALIQAVEGNPLPASYQVVLKDPSLASPLADQVRSLDGVDDVDFKQDTVQRLLAITRFLRIGGAVVMLGLTGAVVFIMVNIARMGIYARRQEIEIMRLVGATDWFVRWPFVVEGALCGLVAALLTVGVVAFGYHRLVADLARMLAFLPLAFDPTFLYKLAAVAVAMGIAVGGGGSLLAVRRFWRVES